MWAPPGTLHASKPETGAILVMGDDLSADDIAAVLVNKCLEERWNQMRFCTGCLTAALAIVEVAATVHPENRARLYQLFRTTIDMAESALAKGIPEDDEK